MFYLIKQCLKTLSLIERLNDTLMAILDGHIQFTGRLGNLSAYRMKGSDKIILRAKGGPSGDKIRKAPEFARVRENIAEFGACGKAAGHIRRRLQPVGNLADYNFTPALCSLAKMIQRKDEDSPRGQRNIYLSRYQQLLPGFSLNKVHPFDSVVRQTIPAEIDPEQMTAVVSLPRLDPRFNLFIPWRQPLYRVVLHLTTISDVAYQCDGYRLALSDKELCSATVYTEWHPVAQPVEAQEIVLQPAGPPAQSETPPAILIAIGIQMGAPVSDWVVEPVRHSGCGKILQAG